VVWPNDGARDYVLTIPADIPVNSFWSVVVYDALSRSELRRSSTRMESP
jgi:hypothetical protein